MKTTKRNYHQNKKSKQDNRIKYAKKTPDKRAVFSVCEQKVPDVNSDSVESESYEFIPKIDCNKLFNTIIRSGEKTPLDILKNEIMHLSFEDCNHNTTLHWAVLWGNEGIIKYLCSGGCDVNGLNIAGETPLHIAAFYSNKTIVKLLLSYGADPNIKTLNECFTPLHYAVYNKNGGIVQTLLEKGSIWNEEGCNRIIPLFLAYMCKNHEAIRIFQKIDEDHKIYEHIKFRDIEGVKLMLKKGCYINIMPFSNNKRNPLLEAIIYGYDEIVKLLLMYGANPKKKHKLWGETIMHTAILAGNPTIVKLLIDYGADPNDDEYTRTRPLHLAAKIEDGNMVKMLLECGAITNVYDSSNDTPLHIATRWGNKEIVEWLLFYGADIDILDSSMNTPLHYATYKFHSTIVKLLLKRGAYFNDNLLEYFPLLNSPLFTFACGHRLQQKFLNTFQIFEKYVEKLRKKKIMLFMAFKYDKKSLLYEFFIGRDMFGLIIK